MQTPVKVVGFRSLDAAEQTRLSSHGLRAGSEITKLLHTPLRDPVECLVGPQLLALEAWLLDHIVVETPAAQP